jgi:hypothetical protein
MKQHATMQVLLEMVFSTVVRAESSKQDKVKTLEAGSNTSALALRVIEGDEMEPSAWGYNWIILFRGI